jgi:ATP-dependent exoDNAse (exonuclease V) beta subunit
MPWEKNDPYWAKSRSHDAPGIYYIGKKQDQPVDHPEFDELVTAVLQEAQSENERLLYVALTRAKHHLLITGHRNRKDKATTPTFHAIMQRIAEQAPSFEARTSAGQPVLLQSTHCSLPDRDRGPAPSTTGPEIAVLSSDRRDIKSLAPNRLLTQAETQTLCRSRFHPFAQEAGSMIHRLLEANLKGETLDPAKVWSTFYQQGARSQYDQLLPAILQEVDDIVASECWHQLITHAQELHPELPLVHLDGDELVRGTMDLLVVWQPDQLAVIDYKTTDDVCVSEDLPAFIRDHQYDQQIATYMRGVRALHPQAQINGYIFFTALQRMVLTHQDFSDIFE